MIMGDTNRVNCAQCGTSYDRHFLLGKQGALNVCPMCGAFISLSSDEEESFSHEDEPDFDEEFNNPDLYFYDIDSEDEFENADLRDVWCQCTSCKKVNTISYNKFDVIKSEYLRLKKGLDITCKGCGKEFSNTVVPKRPDGWRELNQWEKDYEHIPKCPICSSTKIHKISMTNKAASIVTFGIFATGHVSKTYKCEICGSKF